MRKYLINNKGRFYKANLHCHTTVSDGSKTPEEIKRDYKANGYSVIAFTDHDVLIGHPELKDDSFLPLNGYEVEINDTDTQRTCHLCFIAKEENNLKQVCWHREKYLKHNSVNYKSQVQFYDEPDFEREYTPECINTMIEKASKHGFFVTYNHPGWSRENFDDYCKYKGMDAMEIVNYISMQEGNFDWNERVYEDMLYSGSKIFCVAGDDNHNKKPENSRGFDSYGAFVMIKAPTLEYRAVTQALENGDFYASTGAEIDELYVEDGKVYITCSDAVRITYITPLRHAKSVLAESDEVITQASFEIDALDTWFRLKVTDKNGNCAFTNAYFPEENEL